MQAQMALKRSTGRIKKLNEIITHLQVIHTWASYASERNMPYVLGAESAKVSDWISEVLSWLKENVASDITVPKGRD